MKSAPGTRRSALIGAIVLLCCGSPRRAQEPDLFTFACTPGAVSIDIIKEPAFTLEPLAGRPSSVLNPHEFTFDSSPFARVRVYLTATLAEEPTGGRASEAELSVYVETATSIDIARNQRPHWWKLVRVLQPDGARQDDVSQAMVFGAAQIAGCFARGPAPRQCAFAKVSSATSDKSVPLVVIGVTSSEDGANASNWTEARFMLDFRVSPPRVAVTADCTYNEGGGACTAIDSGMMARSTMRCDWAAEAADLLCTETADARGSRRDFYLLSNRVPPRRPSDVGSLQEAAAALAGRGIGQSVVVYGLGPVSWVEELTIDAQTRVMLLASASGFYLAPRSNNGIGPILGVRPHGLLDEGAPAALVDRAPSEWTDDDGPLFRSRRIVRDGRLTVVQIVQTDGDPDGPPSALYWIGIERGAAAFSFDAVRLAGGGKYDHCGMVKVPFSVTSIGAVRRPFQARLRVQPPIVEPLDAVDDRAEWDEASDGQKIAGCVRDGNLRWKGGRFEMDMDRGVCKSPEQPHHVRIEPDGRLSIGPMP